MKLYVVRHGQTDKNVLGVVHGQTESNLTEEGIKEAYKLQPQISQMHIDVVISSPLSRAKKTAEILIDSRLPINIDDRIIESDWGLCEGASINEVDRIKCWNYYLNYDENSIEVLSDFMRRIIEFIDDIKTKYHDKNVLVVTHSAVSRAIYYYLNGIPEDGDLSKINIPNLDVLEYEID